MREIENVADELFAKIRGRFKSVTLGDQDAKVTQDPAEAKFFNFDFEIDGEDYGNVTISLVDNEYLKVIYSKNISKELAYEDREKWYRFLRDLRKFAQRKLLGFEVRDISKTMLDKSDYEFVKQYDSSYDKEDGTVNESFSRKYGTRKSSYQKLKDTKLIFRHSKAVDEEKRGARSRNIQEIFIETSEGERFKVPFTYTPGARALARHVQHGGSIQDDFGQHVQEMVKEMSNLYKFVKFSRNKQFATEEAEQIKSASVQRYYDLKERIQKLANKKFYEQYQIEDTGELQETDPSELKDKFVKNIFDDELAEVLPEVNHAWNLYREQEMKNRTPSPSDMYEAWASQLIEGTWAIPETQEQIQELTELMKQPMEVGIDADNATNALHDILGDNQLFDQLYELYQQEGAEADARDLVIERLRELAPAVAEQVQSSMDSGEDEIELEGLEDPKDNPCWKGYKPVGTKKKNGKTVPNCVPKESAELNQIRKLSGLNEAPQDGDYTLYVDGREMDSSDDFRELMNQVQSLEQGERASEQHEWSIVDNTTGDVAADSESGYAGGYDDEPEPVPDYDPGWDDDEEDDSDPLEPERAHHLAQKIVDRIGMTFPDGDPVDAVIHVLGDKMSYSNDPVHTQVMKHFKMITGVDDHWDYYDMLAADHPELMDDVNEADFGKEWRKGQPALEPSPLAPSERERSLVRKYMKKGMSRPEAIRKAKQGVRDIGEKAPPGREDQVKKLKGKVDNPYAVAWASYNKSKNESESAKSFRDPDYDDFDPATGSQSSQAPVQDDNRLMKIADRMRDAGKTREQALRRMKMNPIITDEDAEWAIEQAYGVAEGKTKRKAPKARNSEARAAWEKSKTSGGAHDSKKYTKKDRQRNKQVNVDENLEAIKRLSGL